ncbi:MAG: hypothetical protein HKL96_10690 [Phycisphaerales bacterium]|nr:hypothetical protein [Phycisphaerales bacterium]
MAERPKQKDGHDDALAALHGMGEPAAANPAPNNGEPPESATGFVAMLAQQPAASSAAEPPASAVNAAATSALESSSAPIPSPNRPRREMEELPMAKIIDPASMAAPAPYVRPKKKPAQSEAYKLLVPLLAVIGFMLLMIGFWALAAVLGIHVPLVPSPDDSGYRSAMHFADIMLICLPISLAMLILAFVMLTRANKLAAE